MAGLHVGLLGAVAKGVRQCSRCGARRGIALGPLSVALGPRRSGSSGSPWPLWAPSAVGGGTAGCLGRGPGFARSVIGTPLPSCIVLSILTLSALSLIQKGYGSFGFKGSGFGVGDWVVCSITSHRAIIALVIVFAMVCIMVK